MKRILAIILSSVLLVSLAACSGNGGNASNDASTSSKADVPAQSAETGQSAEAEQTNSQRDALMTFQVEINGKSLTVPCAYSDLEALGYSLPEDDDLKPNTYTIGTYVKNADGDSLHVQFWNGSDSTKKYSECEVCEIEITLENNLDVKLPGGVVFDDKLTPEMIIEAYGEADYDNDTEDYHAVDYENGGFESVHFQLYKEENMKKYGTVTINHIVD